MSVQDSNRYGALSPTRLAQFEAVLGAALPDDYRAFLLTHNGGTFEPGYFAVSDAEGDTRVHGIFGLHEGPDYERLDDAWEVYRERMPPTLLPVADDTFGNAICVGLTGPARGRMYFWDHEREAAQDGQAYWGNVTEVAPSWSAFVAMLRG